MESDGDGSEVGVPDGVELTASGSLKVTADGAVIDGLDVRGRIWVDADDVTIRNTRVAYGEYHSIRLFGHVRQRLGRHRRPALTSSRPVTMLQAAKSMSSTVLNALRTESGRKMPV